MMIYFKEFNQFDFFIYRKCDYKRIKMHTLNVFHIISQRLVMVWILDDFLNFLMNPLKKNLIFFSNFFYLFY